MTPVVSSPPAAQSPSATVARLRPHRPGVGDLCHTDEYVSLGGPVRERLTSTEGYGSQSARDVGKLQPRSGGVELGVAKLVQAVHEDRVEMIGIDAGARRPARLDLRSLDRLVVDIGITRDVVRPVSVLVPESLPQVVLHSIDRVLVDL